MNQPLVPATLTHVTSARLLPSIQEFGLVPDVGPRSRMLGEHTPRVYLFADPAAAADGVTNWLEECFEPDEMLTLLAISSDSLILTPTFHDSESWEWSCSHAINPQLISIHTLNF